MERGSIYSSMMTGEKGGEDFPRMNSQIEKIEEFVEEEEEGATTGLKIKKVQSEIVS